jgi:hypothetical protein
VRAPQRRIETMPTRHGELVDRETSVVTQCGTTEISGRTASRHRHPPPGGPCQPAIDSATETKQACERHALYAQRMKRVRALLERLHGRRRPPTGPLTTAEKVTADTLRRETLLKESERIEPEQEDRR